MNYNLPQHLRRSQQDPTIEERRQRNGLCYIRKVDSGSFKVRQLVTPTLVFSFNKGTLDGDGSIGWRFQLKQRKATNL